MNEIKFKKDIDQMLTEARKYMNDDINDYWSRSKFLWRSYIYMFEQLKETGKLDVDKVIGELYSHSHNNRIYSYGNSTLFPLTFLTMSSDNHSKLLGKLFKNENDGVIDLVKTIVKYDTKDETRDYYYGRSVLETLIEQVHYMMFHIYHTDFVKLNELLQDGKFTTDFIKFVGNADSNKFPWINDDKIKKLVDISMSIPNDKDNEPFLRILVNKLNLLLKTRIEFQESDYINSIIPKDKLIKFNTKHKKYFKEVISPSTKMMQGNVLDLLESSGPNSSYNENFFEKYIEWHQIRSIKTSVNWEERFLQVIMNYINNRRIIVTSAKLFNIIDNLNTNFYKGTSRDLIDNANTYFNNKVVRNINYNMLVN